MAINLHIRNLSRLASNLDIRRFFIGLDIPEGGVQIVGGQDGDAFVAFTKEADLLKALNLDGRLLLGQSVKLFLAKRSDMERIINKRSQELLEAKYRKERSPDRHVPESSEDLPPWLRLRDQSHEHSHGQDRYSPEPKRRRTSEGDQFTDGYDRYARPNERPRRDSYIREDPHYSSGDPPSRGHYDKDERGPLTEFEREQLTQYTSDRYSDEKDGAQTIDRHDRRTSRSPEYRRSFGRSRSRSRSRSQSLSLSPYRDDRSLGSSDKSSPERAYRRSRNREPGYMVVTNMPYTVTAKDIRECFKGYEIAESGIALKSDDTDSNSLLAYIKFVHLKDAVKVDCTCEGLIVHSRPIQINLVSAAVFEARSFAKNVQPLPASAPYMQYPGGHPPVPSPHGAYPPRGVYPGYPMSAATYGPGPRIRGPYMGPVPIRYPPGGASPYPMAPYPPMMRPHGPYPPRPFAPGPYPSGPVQQPDPALRTKTGQRRTLSDIPLQGSQAYQQNIPYNDTPKTSIISSNIAVNVTPAGQQRPSKQRLNQQSQAEVQNKPLTQFVASIIQKMFYIRLDQVPNDTSASKLWKQLGGAKGPTKGVILFRNTNGGKPLHANIAFISRELRDEAKESKPIFSSHCCRSDGPSVLNFLGQEIAKVQMQVYESTHLGSDRKITYHEKVDLLKAIPRKSLSERLMQKLIDAFGVIHRPVPDESASSSAAFKVVIPAYNQDSKRSHGPSDKTTNQTLMVQTHLKTAKHILRFVKIQPGTRACDVWSWFEGANGPASGVVMICNSESNPLVAYIGFTKSYDAYRDSFRRDRYTVISYDKMMREIRSLGMEFKVYESSTNGDVQVEADMVRLGFITKKDNVSSTAPGCIAVCIDTLAKYKPEQMGKTTKNAADKKTKGTGNQSLVNVLIVK